MGGCGWGGGWVGGVFFVAGGDSIKLLLIWVHCSTCTVQKYDIYLLTIFSLVLCSYMLLRVYFIAKDKELVRALWFRWVRIL